jgi:hypothetical protein
MRQREKREARAKNAAHAPATGARSKRFGNVPLLANKRYDAQSVFTVESLLLEARRQKGLPACPVPAICALDPDGDIVDYLLAIRAINRNPDWACYHTALYTAILDGSPCGVIGHAVGASFATFVA